MKHRSLLALFVAAAACAELAPDDPDDLATPPAALTGPMLTQSVLGQQALLVLVVRLTDGPPYAESDAWLLTNTDARLAEFNTYLTANAYGRASWVFDRRGPINVPTSVCASGVNDVIQRAVLQAAVAATDAAVNYAAVRQIGVLVSKSGTGCPMGASGSRRRVWPISTAEGALDASVFWSPDQFNQTSQNLIHEYAHTLGGAHIETKIAVSGGVRVPIDHTNLWNWLLAPPYFWDHDPLSTGGMRNFALPRKLFWGWITPSEISTPAVTNAYFLRSVESASVTSLEPRAIRVPLPLSGLFHAYVLEYRDGTGYDAGQPAGLYIYADPNDAILNKPELIEPPPFASQTAFTPRPLTLGQSYTDPVYGMKFTLSAVSNGTAMVRVDLNESCTPGATRSCCYFPGYPCNGTLTCTSAGRWGSCWKKCFHTLCL